MFGVCNQQLSVARVYGLGFRVCVLMMVNPQQPVRGFRV